jgi:hypothetical protein
LALKGSRVRRKQLLVDSASGVSNVAKPAAAESEISCPNFVVHDREKAIFRVTADYLRWNAPHVTDLLGRWAS